jgi:hypothetical protein
MEIMDKRLPETTTGTTTNDTSLGSGSNKQHHIVQLLALDVATFYEIKIISFISLSCAN